MTPAEIALLALGLAMDATAVAAARGLAATRVTPRDAALVAALFGGFQALMPLLGSLVGAAIGPWLTAWDHWIAFALLGAIGGKMLWEAAHPDDDGDTSARDAAFAPRALVALAVATSIDALAVGVTLPMLRAPLAPTLATIGLVTAALSALGVYAGRRLGARLGRRLDALGGVVLIGIGARILWEHTHGHG